MSDLNASLNRALDAAMNFALAPAEPPIDEVRAYFMAYMHMEKLGIVTIHPGAGQHDDE